MRLYRCPYLPVLGVATSEEKERMMSKKISSVYAVIKNRETRVAVRRGKVIRVYNRVSLPSLKRMSNSLPLVEKQDLSFELGWKWRG